MQSENAEIRRVIELELECGITYCSMASAEVGRELYIIGANTRLASSLTLILTCSLGSDAYALDQKNACRQCKHNEQY